MAERVHTGGTRSFDYGKGYNPRLNDEDKRGIEEAYEKYYQRKAEEKKRQKIIWISIIGIILILIAGLIILI